MLIALALPAIAGARASAKRVRCMANLHSMGQAIIMYQGDNDGIIPWAVLPIDVRLQWTDPLGAIAEYLEVEPPSLSERGEVLTREPWTCPSDTAEGLEDGTSYIYTPYDFMSIDPSPNPGRLITMIYEIQNWFPLMIDQNMLHTEGIDSTIRTRNVLLLSGVVEPGDPDKHKRPSGG